MSAVQFDLQKFPIPSKLFIDGRWADSEAADAHTLTSAVNDDVISEGTSKVLRSETHHLTFHRCTVGK